MNTEQHKQIASELFARISSGKIADALALMTDDATWRIGGTPELSRSAGLYDKARLGRLFERMLSQLEDGLKMTVVRLVGEGDRVAAEVESSGDLRNGRRYRQQYHFAIDFRGDHIVAIREYLDTQHAFDVWMRP
jgi:uncharacterized protein